LPIHSYRSAPLISTTLPVPSSPITPGNWIGAYLPEMRPRSEGLTVEASTLTKICPYLGLGAGHSLKIGNFPYSCSTRAFWVVIKKMKYYFLGIKI
jgi:hypothetical protein